MGEVVLSSDDMEELKGQSQAAAEKNRGVTETETNNEKTETNNGTDNKTRNGCSSSGAITRWDRLFPRMLMRVLLVEADDSTRQIIAALLRKCSYRVAAVSDGLKAWELLKGRPHNVDLILTEVDLPSISGFALLTLIMEHEVCKNIPVIMMSSQDSVSTVYKCMMRGAADYLVKPIRRNELSNLWQHVWRRKASAANGPQDESVAQDKVEATCENDAASNHSNGNTSCIQRNEENTDKGSDAQSSCTKPELEAESVHMEKMQEFLQPTERTSFPSDLRIRKDEGPSNLGQKLLMHGIEARGSSMGAFEDADAGMMLGKGFVTEGIRRDANMSGDACENNNVMCNRSRDPIDLNGVLNDQPSCNYQNSSSSNGTSKLDSGPRLDLTLRSYCSGFDSHVIEKRHTLGHSNSSAFTRYINKPLQPLNPTPASAFDQEKEWGTRAEKHVSNVGTGLSYNYDPAGASQRTPKSVITLATGQSNHSEAATFCSQQRVLPLPIPVKGIRINSPCSGYGSVVPTVFCSQSGSSSMVSPSSVAQPQESQFVMNTFYQTNPEKNKSDQPYDPLCRNTNMATDQAIHNQEHKLDSLDNSGHISPTTDQSASSSFCNGNVSHLNSVGYGSACGSNSNVDQVVLVRTVSESKNDESYFTNNTNSHWSIQREAALTKFRMKRKDRCFEKKVRYESRKKLAEQRPRVKGQFVRQVPTEPFPAATDGNS